MTDKHPITPPLELQDKWRQDWYKSKVKHIQLEDHIATQAARWGAATVLRAAADALVPATLYQTHWDRTVWGTQQTLRRDLLSIADELDTDE
jgi:hypothetical protein